MCRLIGFTIAVLATVAGVASAGVASAQSTAELTYTVEYSGSYSYRLDSSAGSSGFTHEKFTWSYRGTAKLDANKAPASGSVGTPLSGSVGIGGSRDDLGGSGGQVKHCTLAPIRPGVAPGYFAVGEYGLAVTWHVDLPESFVGATTDQCAGGVPCDTSHCATACSPGPPGANPDKNGNFDPAWSTGIGPTNLGETLRDEKPADLKRGTGTTDVPCFGGRQTEALDIKSQLAVGLGWEGNSFFIHFDDGRPPDIQQPGTPLKPGTSTQTTPTVNIPPKVPQPPTDGAPPLVSGIAIGCPPQVKSCPTLITVTDGRRTLAKDSFSGLKRGIVGLAGLKLKHLTLKRGARKKVTVTVAVKIGKTTHRGSRTVTLTR
jgi:hypothetical protein